MVEPGASHVLGGNASVAGFSLDALVGSLTTQPAEAVRDRCKSGAATGGRLGTAAPRADRCFVTERDGGTRGVHLLELLRQPQTMVRL